MPKRARGMLCRILNLTCAAGLTTCSIIPAQDAASAADTQTSPAIPMDCRPAAHQTLLKPGGFTPHGQLLFGISPAAHVFYFGEPVLFHLWIDNPDDEPHIYLTCSDAEWFAVKAIDVFNSSGQRLLRKQSNNPQNSDAIPGFPISCLRNVRRIVPPHTCVTGDDFDFTKALTNIYDLAPGSYSIRILKKPAFRKDDFPPKSSERFYEPPDSALNFAVVSR